jgi:hypothetical protein
MDVTHTATTRINFLSIEVSFPGVLRDPVPTN